MAEFYRYGIGQFGGTATISVNGEVISVNGQGGGGILESGTTVEFDVDLDEGYYGFIATTPIGTFTTSPFSFTVPQSDFLVRFDITGEFQPIDGYGLKYFWDWKALDRSGNDDLPRRLEIYEDGFGGIAEERKIQNLNYIFGGLDNEPTDDMLVSSKIVFDVVAQAEDFQEFLTGNTRKFKTLYYHDQEVVFEGYVNTDRLDAPEKSGQYIVKFEALDGIKSFEGKRFISQRAGTRTGGLAISFIVGALNQSFVDARNLHIASNIYESRMDPNLGLFEQFLLPYSAIYENGDVAQFSDGTRIVNELLYTSEVLNRFFKPFFVRCFLYKNEWWAIRIPEFESDDKRFFTFDRNGFNIDEFDLEGAINFNCPDFGNARRSSRLIYNEFTSILKLGSLEPRTSGGIFEDKFDVDSFNVTTGFQVGSIAGLYRLKVWNYTRATPFIPGVSPFGGDTALVAFTTDGGGAVEIKNTTSTAGTGDSNISFISLTTAGSGVPISVLQESANTLTIALEFMCLKLESLNVPKIPTTHDFGIMVKIGDSYLKRDGALLFEWVSTPEIMTFRITNAEVWNTLNINSVIVPEDGDCEIRLYQLINNGQPRDRYVIRYRNFKLSVDQNDALANNEIAYKSQTLQDYNRVFPDYVTHIGDAFTNNSLSAIKLTDNSASELWSRDGIEEQPLGAIQVQELANLKGRKNLRIIGEYFAGIPDVRKTVNYDGKKWFVNHFNHNDAQNKTQVELFQIGG